MADIPARTSRKPRVDAVRNRERVLQAAREVFGAGGADASLETVARRAGVGIGTLYRHFPTREALFEAVYRREVAQLTELAGQLGKDAAPLAALRQWLHAAVGFVATKKGMSAALAVAAGSAPHLTAHSLEQLSAAVGALLRRGVEAQAIRGDIGGEDLLRTLFGMCNAHELPQQQDKIMRLVDVFVDGLASKNVLS